MIRARFKCNLEDYRPVKWPPPGPYWCTGYDDEHSIVVAYAADESEIMEYWPDAEDIDATERDGYTFTGRFPKPSWWPIAENTPG